MSLPLAVLSLDILAVSHVGEGVCGINVQKQSSGSAFLGGAAVREGDQWVNPLELSGEGGIHVGIFLARSSKSEGLETVVGPGIGA